MYDIHGNKLAEFKGVDFVHVPVLVEDKYALVILHEAHLINLETLQLEECFKKLMYTKPQFGKYAVYKKSFKRSIFMQIPNKYTNVSVGFQ